MPVFFQLGLLIGLAAAFGMIARLFRQPVVIGYIATGIVLSLYLSPLISNREPIELMASFGIAILLFLVGLELDARKLKKIGLAALITGIGQIAITATAGFLTAHYLFGFERLPSLYIGAGLTFSSTVIVVKILGERSGLSNLYGRLAIGFLLVQDLAAILALIVLRSFGQTANASAIVALLGRSVLTTLAVGATGLLVGRFILPTVFKLFAKSTELLLLAGLAYSFLFASLTSWLGLSVEIGAFLAGVSLASLPYTIELSGKLKPLRDFFLSLFFVELGLSLNFAALGELVWPMIGLSLLVLILNPVVVMVSLGLMKYRKHTLFNAALAISQIGEFSLILVIFGQKLGHIDQNIVSMITGVALITIFVSSYTISRSESLYRLLKPMIGLFERKSPTAAVQDEEKLENHAVLIGYHRIGPAMISELKKMADDVVIVDVDPTIVEKLKIEHREAIFGDAADEEILDRLAIERAKILVSTVAELEDNLSIIRYAKNLKARPPIYVTAIDIEDAITLYQAGADYVIVPHHFSKDQAKFILKTATTKDQLHRQKTAHLKELRGLVLA